MLLTPSQAQIAKDTHRFRVVNCGRQFGKTTLAIEEIKGVVLAKSNARVVYIATTIQQARDIAWSLLKAELAPITVRSREAPSLEIECKNIHGTTSIVQLRGWEAVETLRGQQFDLIVLDEVASMRNFWLQWQEVLLATLAFRQGSALFISTPKGFNHFHELYNTELKDKDFKSFHFTSYDNPHLKTEELDRAREKATEDRFAQEYLADFRKTEGLVYKEFDRNLHVYSGEIVYNKVSRIAGVDFGFTNPCAVLTIEKDTDANYYITNEFYQTGKTDEEIGEYVAAQQFNIVYPDPESASGIEVLRRKKVNVREVNKGKDSIRNGISVVRELFKQNRLKIHSSCTNLIWELETYSYPEKRDMRNEDENPIKENDHAMDAMRYPLMMQEASRNGAQAVISYAPIRAFTGQVPTLNPQVEASNPQIRPQAPRQAVVSYPKVGRMG